MTEKYFYTHPEEFLTTVLAWDYSLTDEELSTCLEACWDEELEGWEFNPDVLSPLVGWDNVEEDCE